MCFCKKKANWRALPINNRKKDVKEHYYCDFCKKYTQEKNSVWKEFKKISNN